VRPEHRAALRQHVSCLSNPCGPHTAIWVYTRTDDAGATFSPLVYVSPLDTADSETPAVVTGWTTAVAVAWTESDETTGDFPVAYALSLDEGRTFSPRRLLSNGFTEAAYCPSLVLAGGQGIYAAWYYASGDGNEGLAFTRSLDSGVSFSTPVRLTAKPLKGWCPQLAADGAGNLHLVWSEGAAWNGRAVFHMRSTDAGSTWSPPQRLSETSIAAATPAGFAIAPDGTLFVPWYDVTGGGCHLSVSTDAGGTFSRPARGAGCSALAPVSASDVHVAYQGGSASSADVFHSRVAIVPGESNRGFHTVAPCRLLDTRAAGPAVRHSDLRTFAVAGRCEVALEAVAVAANITVVQPMGAGHVTLFPAGNIRVPNASTLNFRAGQTRANNAALALGAAGEVTASATVNGGGSIHLVLDVTGYFR
jgi:hypothetical protein